MHRCHLPFPPEHGCPPPPAQVWRSSRRPRWRSSCASAFRITARCWSISTGIVLSIYCPKDRLRCFSDMFGVGRRLGFHEPSEKYPPLAAFTLSVGRKTKRDMSKADQSIGRVKNLRQKFLSLRDDGLFVVSTIEFAAVKDLLESALIRIENGHWFFGYVSTGFHEHEKFFAYARTAGKIIGCSNHQPVTYWLDRIFPASGWIHHRRQFRTDVYRASVRECQRLILEARNGESDIRLTLDSNRIQMWMESEDYRNDTLANTLRITERVVSSMRNNGRSHGRKAIVKLANLMGCDEIDLYLA